MDLNIPLAAPFDFLTFRILNHRGEYSFPVTPDSLFYEKTDFLLCLKGYKDGKLIYECSITQVMRERDFLGVDWENGGFVLATPRD